MYRRGLDMEMVDNVRPKRCRPGGVAAYKTAEGCSNEQAGREQLQALVVVLAVG